MLNAVWIVLLFGFDLIKAPVALPADRGAVVVSDKSGQRRWSANWTMEPADRQGRKAVRFTERGQGHMDPFAGEIRWSLESSWSAEDGLRPLDSEKIITTLAGTRLATERKQFDLNNGTVHFERRFSDGRLREKSLDVPKDTLAVEGIAGVLRFLPFDRITSFPVHLLSNEPRLYSISFENRGKEHVRTPAGEFDCYKLEMVPHLGVLNVVRYFYPKAFFWFTVAPPHFWVRYEGPENGPGTPEIVMELDRDSH